jgi:tRNA G26 N,N-dimethylase Trm1
MEKRFKSLSLFEFQSRFPDSDKCREYLANLKWGKGYACRHCGHGKSCRGMGAYDRQCTRCGYVESPMAGTLFHRLKFPLLWGLPHRLLRLHV